MSLQILLILIGIVTFTSFLLAYRNIKWALVFITPILILLILQSVGKYRDMAGYPVNMVWQEMPDEFTIIFFSIRGDKILLWVEDGKNTRLIRLPLDKKMQQLLVSNGDKIKGGKKLKIAIKDGTEQYRGFEYNIISEGDVIEGELPPK